MIRCPSPNRNPAHLRQFYDPIRFVDLPIDQANDILNGSFRPAITKPLQVGPAILRCKLISKRADRFVLPVVIRGKSPSAPLKQHCCFLSAEAPVSEMSSNPPKKATVLSLHRKKQFILPGCRFSKIPYCACKFHPNSSNDISDKSFPMPKASTNRNL